MKKLLFLMLATPIACFLQSAASADFILDNYSTEQNGATGGAVANFAVQSFTPNVAGLGTLDTVTANSPLPSTVSLQSATFLKAVTGTATSGSLFIDVYLGDGDDGTFVGSSTNSIDVESQTGLTEMTWNFSNFALTSGSEYGLVFSTDSGVGNSVIARLQVARDSGGLFGNTYTGGTADNNANNSSPSVFDSRFRVTMVPEPTSLVMFGVGLVGLAARRRRS